MGGKDSRKDPRKDSASSRNTKGKERGASSSSKSKDKGILNPTSSKGKERSSDDYYAATPAQASTSFAGLGPRPIAQLSEVPEGGYAEEAGDIDMNQPAAPYFQPLPGANEWDNDNISPLRDPRLTYSTGYYAQPFATTANTYSGAPFSEPRPNHNYDAQSMAYPNPFTGLEYGLGNTQFESTNIAYGYGSQQVDMAPGWGPGSYTSTQGANWNQKFTPQTYGEPPLFGGNTNHTAQALQYKSSAMRKVLKENNFQVYQSYEFRPGRIFKIFWFEPEGDNARRQSGRPSSRGGTAIQRSGGHGKVRRFVITEQFPGHCIGIPISTYEYRGTTKPDCHPETHSMIYAGREPDYLPGEAPLLNPKIKVDLSDDKTVFDIASRLNYAKKYTIEHNFQVAFIGDLPESPATSFGKRSTKSSREHSDRQNHRQNSHRQAASSPELPPRQMIRLSRISLALRGTPADATPP